MFESIAARGRAIRSENPEVSDGFVGRGDVIVFGNVYGCGARLPDRARAASHAVPGFRPNNDTQLGAKMHPSAPSSTHPAAPPPGGRTRAQRRRRGLTAVIAAIAPIAALLTVISVPTMASATTVPGPPSGWSTVFSDDFAGSAGSGIDSQWIYDTGAGSSFGTGEIETMTNSTSNVSLDGNGDLDITAVDDGGNWTSGRVQTSSANVGAPAGGELEVTASIDQPNAGPGYWPAFWMLGSGQWPENGEIDIMEDVNSLSELSGTIHCGTDPGGPCNEPNGIGSGLVGCGGCQSGYHTYTMILDRTDTSDESITFYLDGNEYFSVSEGQVGTSTWQAAFDHNLSIILDLAIGGSYPNGQCGCTTPTSASAASGTMSVQYVAAYETSS
jgi:beta-glucanase (GH16 family)